MTDQIPAAAAVVHPFITASHSFIPSFNLDGTMDVACAWCDVKWKATPPTTATCTPRKGAPAFPPITGFQQVP